MGLPVMDIQMSKKPVAMLITGVNEIKPIAIKKQMNGYFVDNEHGVFMIDPTKALRYDKQALYFYDIRSAKPLNMLALKSIQDFASKNGLEKITVKDVKHGGWLRRLTAKHKDPEKALSELKVQEQDQASQVHNEIESINMELQKKNEEAKTKGEGALSIEPGDYSGYVIEALVAKGLVTRGEASSIKFELISGKITIDDFIRKLEQLHKIDVHYPITSTAQLFIEDYRTFDPSKVLAYIKGAKGLGKDIKDLGQPTIKNLIPLTYIIIGIVGVAIMALVLSSVNLEQLFKNLIPSDLFG